MRFIPITLPLSENDVFELLDALRDGYALPDELCKAFADYVERMMEERDWERQKREVA